MHLNADRNTKYTLTQWNTAYISDFQMRGANVEDLETDNLD
jgi:hypothetical protein